MTGFGYTHKWPKVEHSSPGCACGANSAGEVFIDPICRVVDRDGGEAVTDSSQPDPADVELVAGMVEDGILDHGQYTPEDENGDYGWYTEDGIPSIAEHVARGVLTALAGRLLPPDVEVRTEHSHAASIYLAEKRDICYGEPCTLPVTFTRWIGEGQWRSVDDGE